MRTNLNVFRVHDPFIPNVTLICHQHDRNRIPYKNSIENKSKKEIESLKKLALKTSVRQITRFKGSGQKRQEFFAYQFFGFSVSVAANRINHNNCDGYHLALILSSQRPPSTFLLHQKCFACGKKASLVISISFRLSEINQIYFISWPV